MISAATSLPSAKAPIVLQETASASEQAVVAHKTFSAKRIASLLSSNFSYVHYYFLMWYTVIHN